MQFCFRCLVFSDFSDSQYSVFKVQSGFSSVSKISSSKWVRQPPILPYRLQYSTFGRYGLHRRVRDGNGCYPIPYHHRKYPFVLLFHNVRAGNFTVLQPSRSANCFACRLAPGCVSYISLFVSQSLHASMQSFETKILLQEL